MKKKIEFPICSFNSAVDKEIKNHKALQYSFYYSTVIYDCVYLYFAEEGGRTVRAELFLPHIITYINILLFDLNNQNEIRLIIFKKYDLISKSYVRSKRVWCILSSKISLESDEKNPNRKA